MAFKPESSFIGPGMRRQTALRYFPCRLSLVPVLLREQLPPDIVLVQTSPPHGGTVSLGTEVNVLPAAIEAARARGGLVIAQLNPRVPYTYGDAVLPAEDIDFAIESDLPLPSRRVTLSNSQEPDARCGGPKDGAIRAFRPVRGHPAPKGGSGEDMPQRDEPAAVRHA